MTWICEYVVDPDGRRALHTYPEEDWIEHQFNADGRCHCRPTVVRYDETTGAPLAEVAINHNAVGDVAGASVKITRTFRAFDRSEVRRGLYITLGAFALGLLLGALRVNSIWPAMIATSFAAWWTMQERRMEGVGPVKIDPGE